MICQNCKKQNKGDANFCRFCGAKMVKNSKAVTRKDKPHLNLNFISFINKLSYKRKLIISIAILVIIIVIILLPKTIDTISVDAAIKNAKQLELSGKYQDALSVLKTTDVKWITVSKTNQILSLEDKENRFIVDQQSFDLATSKENNGDLSGARDALRKIDTDFPNYSEVQSKLDEIQSKIEAGLTSDKEAAEAEAASEAKAKQQAQAEAQSQAEAAAQAQAEATANQQAANEAQAEAQKKEADRVAQVKRSFMNELVNAYSSASDAHSTYTSGIQYANNQSSLMAMTQMNSVLDLLKSTLNNISDLNTRYTNLPSGYYTASNNLTAALNSLNSAAYLVVEEEYSGVDYSSQINNYNNYYNSYMASVKSFIDNNNN